MADLEDVIAEHGSALERVARLYARSAADRDDLLQDIMMGLLRSLPMFRGESSLKTYVLRIAHLQGMRRAWRREKLILADDLDDLADDGKGDPEAALSRRLDHERLLEAIKELPLGLKAATALALEGLTSREIGDILGLSDNAVDVRLHRARRALRRALGERHG